MLVLAMQFSKNNGERPGCHAAPGAVNRSLKTKEKTTTHLFRMEIHPVRDSSVIE